MAKDKTWADLQTEVRALKAEIETARQQGFNDGARAASSIIKVKSGRQKRLDEQAVATAKSAPKTPAADQAIKKPGISAAPVYPNAGVEAEYRKRLGRLIDEMARSLKYWLQASYRANEPAIMAEDEAPADALRKAMGDLSKRWQKRFDEVAEEVAEHFAKSVSDRSDAALRASLRKAGFTVKFKPTAAQRDVLKATVHENVALIRSIPSQYLTQVEGSVMRAVQVGGDLSKLTDELANHHGVTRRRAANIARDQNNRANAALKRQRQLDLGIVEEEWRHTGAGKHPRASHVKAGKDRIRYNVKDGWLDPAVGQRVWPGSLIGCRCVGRPIIPGL